MIWEGKEAAEAETADALNTDAIEAAETAEMEDARNTEAAEASEAAEMEDVPKTDATEATENVEVAEYLGVDEVEADSENSNKREVSDTEADLGPISLVAVSTKFELWVVPEDFIPGLPLSGTATEIELVEVV